MLSDIVNNRDEGTPLLHPAGNPDSSKAKLQVKGSAYYLGLALMFLVQAGTTAPIAPTTSILEKAICARWYGFPHGTENQLDCKTEEIQGELAMLKGITSLALMLPGIFLVVPYGILADRYGGRFIMVISIVGILGAELWYDIVCWKATAWPSELLWASPVFYLLGGGPAAFISLLFVSVANASPPNLRSSRFFHLEAASYVGSLSSYLLSSVLMEKDPWIPILLGLCSIAIAAFLLPFSAESEEIGAEPAEVAATTPRSLEGYVIARENTEHEDSQNRGLWKAVSSAFAILVNNKSTLLLLVGYWLRMLAVSVTRLQLLYISQLFGWNYSKAGYMVSLDSTIHLAVLLLLPGVAATLTSNFKLDSLTKDWWLARISVAFATIGSAGVAFSRTPVLMASSIILFGLGAGYSSSVRGVLTSTTAAPHRRLLYSSMSMVDIIGTLIGAPMWPAIYHLGLKNGGWWTGLPFSVAAILFVIVLGTLEISRYAVRTPLDSQT